MLIWIIRHGKAEQDSPTGRDVDRALRPRGRLQAEWLASQFLERDDAPVRLISSPALRARETGRIVSAALGAALEFDDRLRVDEPVGPLLDLLGEVGRTAPEVCAALFGHNPQLSALVRALSGVPVEMRTGEAIAVELGDEIEPGAGSLAASLRLDSSSGRD